MSDPDIALVTGANRGIGFEVSRQLAARGYTTILGARDAAKGAAAAAELAAQGLTVVVQQLDVTDVISLQAATGWVEQSFGRLDVLVNNAGALYDPWEEALDADLKTVQNAFDTNTLGPWRTVQAFSQLLKKSSHGRIVNVSSGAGSLTAMKRGTPAYAVSKTALNALTRMLADELRSSNILVNSVCPGWVANDGSSGGRPISEGAASVVWAAVLPDDGPTGGFFRDGQRLAW